MNFTQYNKNNFEKIEWGVDTNGFVFKKIGDLFNEGVKKVQVFGFFFIKSENYGLQPIAILKDCLLNLPTRFRDIISEMLKDKEAVESIKKGECGLKFRQYKRRFTTSRKKSSHKSKYNKDCFDVDFYNYVVESTDNAVKPIF